MTLGQLLLSLAVGLLASLAGGALSGVVIGGKDLGKEVAGMMGAFYGPMGGFVGTVLALLSFFFLRQSGS